MAKAIILGATTVSIILVEQCGFSVSREMARYMTENILYKFGQRVRQLRLKSSWSQEKLAEKTGLHRTYIGGVERGERNIALENIEKLAMAFGISVSELLTLSSESQESTASEE